MENPRNKNKMIKESSDITFRVLCVAPKSMPANGETAIYEIDIQSDFEFCNSSRKMRLRKSSGEISVKSMATRDSSTETQNAPKRQNCKNPIIQSYYPTLLDTCSEGSESQLDLQTNCKEVTFADDSEKFYIEEDDEMQKSNDEPVLEITDLKKAAENTEIAEVDKPEVDIAEVRKSVVEITEMAKPEVQKPVVQTSKPEIQKPVVQIAEVQKLILHIAELQKCQVEKSDLEELEVQTARLEKPIVEITEVKPVLEKIGINVVDLRRSDFAKTQTVLSENVPKVLIERAEVDKVGIEEVGMRKFGLKNAISSVEPEKGEIRKVNVDKSGIDKPELDGTEKDSQSSGHLPDNKLEQNFKTFLIETFFKKNNSDLKALFQSTEKKAEPSELHLHHHEHHHHYYFGNDGNPFMKEQDSPRGPPQGPPGPGPDPDPGPGSTFFYKCEAKSNSTFTRVTKSRMAADFQEGRASAQCSVSDESVLDKKSEFIKSHTYSDSDFTKAHSGTEVVEEEQQPRKSSKEGMSLLAASLRSAAQYKAPLIITDQEKLPKISYITCECNSVDNIPRTSTVSFSSDLNTDELEELEELGDSDKTSGDSELKTGYQTIN